MAQPATTLPAKWRELFALLPGYDPVATAADGQWFCVEEAERAIEFFHTQLTHVEGTLAGKPFILEPWQQAIVGCLFGWLNPDLSRRYRTVLLYVPRKNGKTPLAAGIALFVLTCDGEIGAEIPLAAASADQASLLFRQAAGMVDNGSELSERCRVFRGIGQRSIVCERLKSRIKVVSGDADTQHGGNGYCAVVDEVHALKKRDLIDVIETSMASANRRHTLLVEITTADYERESICNEIHEYAGQVRDGRFDDPTFLPVIFEANAKDDWADEAVWRKANPNLGVSVSLAYMREKCEKARNVPAFQNTFRRLHLNQKTEQVDRWLDMAAWKRLGAANPKAWRAAALQRHAGQRCIAAMDIGATRDLTALVLAWGDLRSGLDLVPWFWLPKDGLEYVKPMVRELYANWLRAGWITATEGNQVDYEQVVRDVIAIRGRFPIAELELDKAFQGASIENALNEAGIPVVPFGQSSMNMTAPIKEFSEMVTGGLLRHGNNPVLNWMAANAAVKISSDGLMKLQKPARGSMLKIDGIVCGVMCVGGLQRSRSEKTRSVYADGKVGV